MFGALIVINSFPAERMLVLRERAAGTYYVSVVLCRGFQSQILAFLALFRDFRKTAFGTRSQNPQGVCIKIQVSRDRFGSSRAVHYCIRLIGQFRTSELTLWFVSRKSEREVTEKRLFDPFSSLFGPCDSLRVKFSVARLFCEHPIDQVLDSAELPR